MLPSNIHDFTMSVFFYIFLSPFTGLQVQKKSPSMGLALFVERELLVTAALACCLDIGNKDSHSGSAADCLTLDKSIKSQVSESLGTSNSHCF